MSRIIFSIFFLQGFCHKKTEDFSYDIHHAYDEIDSIIDESEEDKMNPTSRGINVNTTITHTLSHK